MAVKEIRQKDPRTGITYVYMAEVVWDKEKKQSRYASREMLGHVDPGTGEVVPNRPRRAGASSPEARRVFAGATHLLGGLADQTGLAEDLEAVLGPGRAAAVGAFAQFLAVDDPSPARRFPLWARTHAQPLGDAEVSSQRWSELFASVGQAELEAFFRARVRRASGSYWFFDTTSVSSCSQLLERVRWGKNKERRRLPQINLAVVKDAATGAPLAFKDLPGNINDVSLVKSLLADFRLIGTGRVKLCMDRGFYSKTNVDALMGEHMKFLIGVRVGLAHVRQAINNHGHALRSWEHYDRDRDIYAMRLDHPWDWHRDHPRADAEDAVRRSYLHLFFDPAKAVDSEKDFARLLDALWRELDSGKTVSEHDELHERYFRKVRGGWTGRDDQIAAERARHGYFALLSNDAGLDCWQALDVYRAKDQIEKAFHDLKDRLDLRTTHLHNHETLTGKLLTAFVALILTTELRRRINASGLARDHTMDDILDELETIEEYHHAGRKPRILHITDKQHEIYDKLGVQPPATS